jgi:hypothetical protein
MSEQTARLVARLRARLRRTTRRMTWAELAFGAAVAGGVVATVWLLATLLEANLWLGTVARTALAAAVGTVAVGVIAVLLARPLGRLVGLLPGPSDEEVARKVGSHYPTVADRLVNLLQLAEGKRSHAPAPLVDQAVQHLADDLDDVSFEEIEDFGRARRALRLASLPLAGVLAFLLVAPSTFLGASERLLAPNTEFDRPAPFQLRVSPGDARLVQGDSLRVTIRALGSPPETVELQLRDSTEEAIDRRSLRPDSAGTFRHTIPTVRRSFAYRVHASPLHTDWHTVRVVNRPLVRRLQLTVSPPDYTGLPRRTLDPNVGDVTALPGSRVRLTATLGGAPAERASIAFDDGRTQDLTVQDGTAQGRFTLRREGSYVLRLQSTAGTANQDPIRYRTSLQADAQPSVTFLQPEGTSTLDADLRQTLRVQFNDDFGLTQAKLFYRRTEERFGEGQDTFSSVPLPLPDADEPPLELVHEWLLAQDTGLDPEPGDVISYYVKAWDNDTVNGPKSGRTATQRLRMPSLSEKYEQLDQTQTEAGDQMRQLRERADSVRQQFRQLRQELRRTREADWQDRRQLERIQQQQKSVEQGVEKLSKQVEQMNRQMQQSGLSSPETTQKFEELQRVIEEINSPELQKALDQLRKAMQNSDLRQMQRAMERVQKNEQSYQEQLDRTLSLFKQLQAQQKLEEMARRAGELSDLEKTLREKTRERMETDPPSTEEQEQTETSSTDSTATTNQSSNEAPSDDERAAEQTRRPSPTDSSTAPRRPSPSADSARSDARSADAARRDSSAQSRRGASPQSRNEDLAREQERAAEKMRSLMKELEKAQSEMKDVQSAPKKQLQRMQKQLRQRNLPKQMQNNSQQLRQNQLQDAQEGQRRMQQQLRQTQKQLSQMKSQMQGQQRQINVAGLRTALENTLRLSKQQEALRRKVSDLATQGPTLRRFARDQKTLSDGLNTVADSLQSIASRVPEMSREVQSKTGNALRAMETATTALDERDARRATGHQKTSMMHLNELALLLSDLLENLQNQQGSGSGMSMQQMMQKLKQMSGQQQKLNNQIQQHLNQVQGERLSKDQAQRQKELAKQQRRIKKQLQEMDVGSKARNQIMGDLEKIAEQMEETAQQLERGRHSRDLIERQKQILTRLLNAQKSLRTQGKQRQRRGQEADDDYDRQRPGPLPDTEDADQLRRDLIRALEMGYSPDYEELIKRYFDLLQKRNEPNPK